MGHYVADLAQPLHVTENHDGQLTGQKGLHHWFEENVVDALSPYLYEAVFQKAKNEWNLIFKKALEMKGSEYQEMMDFLILRANGLSGSQIAELKEIPLGTVKSNLRRCRAFLKEVALSLNLNPAIND
jgi:DNA-directed RNA polymerase specialized sigma24 family protein